MLFILLFAIKLLVQLNIAKQLTQMTTKYNKHIITNEITWRQLLFPHATSLSLSKISVVFDISSSHSKLIYQLDVFH